LLHGDSDIEHLPDGYYTTSRHSVWEVSRNFPNFDKKFAEKTRIEVIDYDYDALLEWMNADFDLAS
jgi:hypothetical protein